MAASCTSATGWARISSSAASMTCWRRRSPRSLLRRGAGTGRAYRAGSARSEHRPAAHDGPQHLGLADGGGRDLHRVLRDHDVVGELAALQRACPLLGAHLVRAVGGDGAEGLGATEARIAVEAS